MLNILRNGLLAVAAMTGAATQAQAAGIDPVVPAAGVTATATPVPAAASASEPAPAPAPAVRRTLAELVAEHLGATGPDEAFDCLASAVYYEARGEPLEGQLAVAEVILNRVRSGRFRASVCEVVTQPSQFSFVRAGRIPEAPRSSAAWQRAAAIAFIALNDLADATGDESLFFHAARINPRWGRPRVARIGNHIFYR